MIYLIALFVCGALTGMSFILFLVGATKTEKEHEIFMEGYNEGLKRMEHEIPKKPVEDTLGFICPVCKRNVWGIVSKMYYCAHCGQKMGWDEAELEEKKGQAHDK